MMLTPMKWPLRFADRWQSKKLRENAKPVILEPIMKVDVTTPEAHMGDVIGDLNRRRGQIVGQESHKGAAIVHAEVPLSEMFGYSTLLRSLSSGRGRM